MTNELTLSQTSDYESEQIPIFIVRLGTGTAIAIREGQGSGDWVDLALDLFRPLVDLLPGLIKGGKASGRTFTMDKDSLRKWDTLAKHGADGYSFGVLWGSDGKIASHVRLREASSSMVHFAPGALDPMVVAQLALIVSLKSDIERLEVAIAEVGADVKNIMRFLEVDQESNVLAALDTIHSIHGTLKYDGRVVQEDWDRVKGLEQILKAVERQVLSEMHTIGEKMHFSNVDGAKDAVKSLKAERLQQLKLLLYYNLWAQGEWYEIMIARKAGSSELRTSDIEETCKSMDKTRARAIDILRTVEKNSNPDSTIQGTSAVRLLGTRGLVGGWKYEGNIIRNGTRLRREMLEVALDRSVLEPTPETRIDFESVFE